MNISQVLVLGFLALFLLLVVLYFVGTYLWRKLREGEKLKYEFITIVAHKFRTPLTQMKWLAEGLITGEQDSYKKQSLEEMRTANQTLIDLTATLIEMADASDSSGSSYAFEEINVCDLTKSVADSFKNTFHEKNLFLSVQCSLPEIWINADRARLEFVLQTLLQNASTYSPPGRNIDVSVGLDKKYALIVVTDHGIGISPSDLPRIFTKFFRTEIAQKTDTEGFGVGLYLAQSVVHRHKGKIEVYSDGLGKGTTFQISIPAIAGSKKTIAPSPAPVAATPLPQPTPTQS